MASETSGLRGSKSVPEELGAAAQPGPGLGPPALPPRRLGATFWRIITRFEQDKMLPGVGLRNAIGVTLPLLFATLAGSPAAGLIISTGALNVSLSDGPDPYFLRGKRMLASSCICALAVLAGAAFSQNPPLMLAVTAAWAFAAGMLVALDQAAADIGTISLVTLVVFAGQPFTQEQAVGASVLAFCGGLLQTGLSLALWPLRRYEPVRRTLAALYAELAQAAAADVEVTEAPPASAQSTLAQRSLMGLSRSKDVQGERYLLLLSQAERIRLSLLMLARLRTRLRRQEAPLFLQAKGDQVLQLAAQVLGSVSDSLLLSRSLPAPREALQEIAELSSELGGCGGGIAPEAIAGTLREICFQLDALAGQLRSAHGLSADTSPAGREAFARKEAEQHWSLRLSGTWATLRANLTLRSAACRHAIRLATCLAIADALALTVEWGRSYWLPMTIAIVLKPDFTSTFSRGLLRFAGTFIGLLLATAIFHWMAPAAVTEVALVGVLAFLLRFLGPANYGILVIAISALVVVFLALTGVAPREAIAERGLNTAVGGLFALVAYLIWPSWERNLIPETMAQLLDAYRQYFQVIRESYLHPEISLVPELDRARLAARLARSNLEAAVERFDAEPGTSAERVALLKRILASSHRLVHACMALEAGLTRSHPAEARPAFRPFANTVELTLHSLAGALRGSPLQLSDLPDLRARHSALVQSGDVLTERYLLVNVEADRLTNSLNTLTGQVMAWTSGYAAQEMLASAAAVEPA